MSKVGMLHGPELTETQNAEITWASVSNGNRVKNGSLKKFRSS